MNINQSISRDIDVINPTVAPTENPAVPTEQPAVPTTAIGEQTEVMGTEGLPQGTTSPIDESIPKPSGFVTPDDAISPQESPQETKDDPRRHEYWQSKHDKVQSELSQARDIIGHYENTHKPIVDGLKQNPDILNALEQRVTNSNGQVVGSPPMQMQQPQVQQQQVGNQLPSLQAPVRPERPMTYSEVDAFNDPESESFKFRQAKDKYMDDIVDHYGKIEAMRNQFAMNFMQQRQNQMHLDNMRTTAVKNMGMTDDKANRFVEYVQNPKNITTERLAALFEMEEANRRGLTKENVERQRKAEEYERQRQMQATQAPAALATGPATPQVSTEDNFNSWLLSNSKVKR